MRIFEWLKLPETRGVENLDDPSTTLLHTEIIQKKPFLKKLYIDFYKQFERAMPSPENKVLVELGSGGGFIKEVIGNVITSDILELPNVDKVFSAFEMPFADGSVDAFFMVDVLHHITDAKAFFTEALRCLKVSGKIVMIEPANTLLGRFIYGNFHHELFDPEAGWNLEDIGPLSHGNGALPWIIFRRDRKMFENEFPSLKIIGMHNHTPLRYLLSGGLRLRQLMPSCSYPLIKTIEWILYPINGLVGMFQTIELEKLEV
ncbi:MAG: class I SAM-dependent methyltransferase [Planctomycetes bacterium]|nr:class I SAM-dependent methyltransferase [Planctomycetota bacterium]